MTIRRINISKLSRFLLKGALGFALLLVPFSHNAAQARTPHELIVDIHVIIHGSDLGISQETTDTLISYMLAQAGIKNEIEKTDSVAVQLNIDIYGLDKGRFKISGLLSGGKDEVDNGENRAERECEGRDKVDATVAAIVRDFIKFIHRA
jgi:hypothetical protein